ncbi:hypothetical protein PLICRDRAFT_180920 [Plicaturopsis crispa FD-325 SS-3]|uniref:Uncharacterized protein n=1 Tax=Plicaturopsis crispa FD-325 SS-3 TaxID=944288 RepID=A0A0C9SV94_PLICR|nr:hypothetical protein PLICRDRAFT_180920 [Plicaturopsis crispa FD-325 SS-3]
MGRSAKYLTAASKSDALKSQRREYARSDRGKAARKEQNKRAYIRAHSRRGPPPRTTMPTLPQALRDTAAFDLPTHSTFFLEASRSADALDESELAEWDRLPPYPSPAPPDIFRERTYTDNLSDLMDGRRLREERARISDFRAQYVRGTAGSRETMIALIEAAREDWKSAAEALKGDVGCPRHRKMADNYMRWQARTACVLYDTLQELS